MPHVDKEVAFFISLYRQCKSWRLLPRSGGLFDQDLRVMEMLNLIDVEVDRWRMKKYEDDKSEAQKGEMLRGLGGGR